MNKFVYVILSDSILSVALYEIVTGYNLIAVVPQFYVAKV
jgi:hypothetical protein